MIHSSEESLCILQGHIVPHQLNFILKQVILAFYLSSLKANFLQNAVPVNPTSYAIGESPCQLGC